MDAALYRIGVNAFIGTPSLACRARYNGYPTETTTNDERRAKRRPLYENIEKEEAD